VILSYFVRLLRQDFERGALQRLFDTELDDTKRVEDVKTSVLVLLSLLLLVAPAVSQTPDDNKLIVPGVRIEKWT
jgi:hypothetical protein